MGFQLLFFAVLGAYVDGLYQGLGRGVGQYTPDLVTVGTEGSLRPALLLARS